MELSKGKIIIYALTFLGYVYAGYSAGITNKLRDAVLAAETAFGDVFQNLINVARKSKDVHEVFDAAVVGNCHFKCPNDVKPVKNNRHTPSSNGCGSPGAEVRIPLVISEQSLPLTAMTVCCDEHDICYDTCNSDKKKCDFDFKRCLYKMCDYFEKFDAEKFLLACKTGAKLVYNSVLTFGCKPYKEAQSQACFCPKNKNRSHTGGEL